MEFVIGLLSGVVLFAVVLASVFVGYRMGGKQRIKPSDKNEEEVRKASRLREDFMSLMNYDVSIALQRKKVE